MARVLVFESQGAKGPKGSICWFCSDPGRRVQDQNTPSPDGRLLAVEGRVSNLGWRGIHLLDPRTICRSCGAPLRRDLHFTPTGRVYPAMRGAGMDDQEVLSPERMSASAQFSSNSPGTRSNSLISFVTSINPDALA